MKKKGRVPSDLSENSIKPKKRKSPGKQKKPPGDVRSVMKDY